MSTPRFTIRLSDQDRARLARIATAHDRDLAAMIRQLIRAEARRLEAGSLPAPAGSKPAATDQDEDDFGFVKE